MSWSRLYYNGSRVTLFVINILFILVGIGMISVMSILINANNEIKTFEESFRNSEFTQAILHLIIGIGAIFLGVIGALASKLKNQNILPFYVSIMVSLFITTVVNGFTLFFSQKQTEGVIKNDMNTQIVNTDDNSTWVAIGVDIFQQEFKCCGANGWQDWNDSFNSTIPLSCCKVRQDVCNVSIPRHLFSNGCAGQYYDYFVFFMSVLESSNIVLAVMEAICIICCTVMLYEKGKMEESDRRRLQQEEFVVCMEPVSDSEEEV